MIHVILCDTFRQAVITAKAFANHYTESGDMRVVKRQTEVVVGDNRFIFANKDDPRSIRGIRGNVIQQRDFVNKYFDTQKSQSV